MVQDFVGQGYSNPNDPGNGNGNGGGAWGGFGGMFGGGNQNDPNSGGYGQNDPQQNQRRGGFQ